MGSRKVEDTKERLMDETSLMEWICNNPLDIVAILLAMGALSFLAGVFAATGQWVWILWKSRKKD